MDYIAKIKEMIENAYLYVPYENEAILVQYWDHKEKQFYGTGEESGDEISVEYDEVDLEKDLFYRLSLMEVNVEEIE